VVYCLQWYTFKQIIVVERAKINACLLCVVLVGLEYFAEV
jgi:hypothetical protein